MVTMFIINRNSTNMSTSQARLSIACVAGSMCKWEPATISRKFYHRPLIIMIIYFQSNNLGRILWPIIVQFRCPHSGTTFSWIYRFLYAEYEFTCCHSHKPAVFLYFTIKHQHFIIKISAILFRKLHDTLIHVLV
jgi:hypothetical protein